MSWDGGRPVERDDVRNDALLAVLEALVAQPHLDAAGVARHSGLQERGVVGAVEQLVGLGVLRPREEGDDGWVLVHPRSALNGLVADRERRLADHLDELAETRRLVDSLSGVFPSTGAHFEAPGVTTLHHRVEVMDLLAELGREVRNEVCSFLTVQPPAAAAAEGERLDGLLLERGVTVRMICLESFYRDAAVARHLMSSVDLGIRIRTRPTLPTRMILFDRSVAVIPLDPDVLAEGAVVIDHATIVHLLHSLFEVHWKDSDPVSQTSPSTPAEGPRPMELAVLNLLALGYKDEAIARSTGQSTRTVRRLVSGLAVTLEARSRFDLALRASARGWIDSPFA